MTTRAAFERRVEVAPDYWWRYASGYGLPPMPENDWLGWTTPGGRRQMIVGWVPANRLYKVLTLEYGSPPGDTRSYVGVSVTYARECLGLDPTYITPHTPHIPTMTWPKSYNFSPLKFGEWGSQFNTGQLPGAPTPPYDMLTFAELKASLLKCLAAALGFSFLAKEV